MPETDTEAVVLATANTWDASTRLQIETNEGRIEFQVHQSADQPMIDLLHTPEGNTTGPLLRFLGSVASKDTLLDGELHAGVIIRSCRIVVEAGERPFLLTGRVETVKKRTGRQRKISW